MPAVEDQVRQSPLDAHEDPTRPGIRSRSLALLSRVGSCWRRS